MTKAELETKLAKAKRLLNKYNRIEAELDILLWGEEYYTELLREQRKVISRLGDLLGAKPKKVVKL